MKTSVSRAIAADKRKKQYDRELNYLQEWFFVLNDMFANIKPELRSNLLIKNMAFVIEILLYNMFNLNANTRSLLLRNLKTANFTQIFPEKEFPALIAVIDLQMQTKPFNTSQAALWEKFTYNPRIDMVKLLGTLIVQQQPEINLASIKKVFSKIDINPVQALKAHLNIQAAYWVNPNAKSFQVTPARQKKIKKWLEITERESLAEYKKFCNCPTNKIILPSSGSRFSPLINWWNRESIVMSELTIKVLMLCELAADPTFLSIEKRASLQESLLQIKQQISALKPNWFSRKLGLSSGKILQLQELEARVIKVEQSQLLKAKEQGDGQGSLVGIDSDSDLDLDLDLEDEPSAKPISVQKSTMINNPQLLPTLAVALELLPKLLLNDSRAAQLQPPAITARKILAKTSALELKNAPHKAGSGKQTIPFKASSRPILPSSDIQPQQLDSLKKPDYGSPARLNKNIQVSAYLPRSRKRCHKAIKTKVLAKPKVELTKIPVKSMPKSVKPTLNLLAKCVSRPTLTPWLVLNIFSKPKPKLKPMQPTAFASPRPEPKMFSF